MNETAGREFRVLLASPRGWCAGVDRAVRIVEAVLGQSGPPVYVWHEIVHNRHVVDDLAARGVVFVESLEDVPAGATLIFSAHGVSPALRTAAGERSLDVIDATCPLVAKVHAEARRFAREERTVVVIGKAHHQETIGTLGEVPDHGVVAETIDDIDAIAADDSDEMAFVTQTTLSVDETAKMIARLRSRFPRVASPPKEDICYATTNRQLAVRRICLEADLVLVVGSGNSHNSVQLVRTAQDLGVEAHLIEDASRLDEAWLDGRQVVGVTSGASVPERLVDELLERLETLGSSSVEELQVVEEDIQFQPPRHLRR